MQFAWMDQGVVLFISTVDDGRKTITREQRRPTKKSTNANIFRVPFSDDAVKDLPNPTSIDDYNHHMNGVDHADQLRSYYLVQRTYRRTWMLLFYFLLDTAVINAYKLSKSNERHPYREMGMSNLHKEFRIQLVNALIGQTEEHDVIRPPPAGQLCPASPHRHQRIKLGRSAACYVCKFFQRNDTRTTRAKRKPLSKLQPNALAQRQRGRALRSTTGCSICRIHICHHKQCWEDHLDMARRKHHEKCVYPWNKADAARWDSLDSYNNNQ